MFSPWYNLTKLALESQAVIGLRLMRLFFAGADAYPEVQLMVVEKLDAAAQAACAAACGHSPDSILVSLRAAVQANALRLSA